VQWRSAMIRAAIQPGPDAYWRSDRYARLDPSEKGAVSFFLGQAQAKATFTHRAGAMRGRLCRRLVRW
jgi:hypothetical protein